MSGLLKVSESASLALHAMVILARSPDRRFSNAELASALGASEHTLAKVLQRLTRAGLIESVRGPHGGFVLARPADRITLLEIHEGSGNPVAPAGCLLSKPICDGKECVLGGLVRSIQEQVVNYYSQTSLAQLAARVEIQA